MLHPNGNTGTPTRAVVASPDEATDNSSLLGKPSIAVLAFTNMSDDRDQEFFSDGIADDIITELSRSRSLFVIARNSSFTYKGRAVDVKQVARELDVRYVVEGSVRRSGSRVRVTASSSTRRPGITSGPSDIIVMCMRYSPSRMRFRRQLPMRFFPRSLAQSGNDRYASNLRTSVRGRRISAASGTWANSPRATM